MPDPSLNTLFDHAPIGGPGLSFGFSTLGCPDLNVSNIRALAEKHGSRFIEIRMLSGSIDFAQQLAGYPGGPTAARAFLLQKGIRVQLVGSSFQLTRATDRERAALIAEAEAGEAMGAQWLRVFGGGNWGDGFSADHAKRVLSHRLWWAQVRAMRGWTIDLILETHDAFSGSAQIREIFAQTGGPMPLLWDAHHTWKIGGEKPEYSWAQFGKNVRHVHLKDSVVSPGAPLGYTYVPPGKGEFPFQPTLALLNSASFAGVVSLEWEKQWHPALEPLDSILPFWNKAISQYPKRFPFAGRDS